jgi:hypothetical protein
MLFASFFLALAIFAIDIIRGFAWLFTLGAK